MDILVNVFISLSKPDTWGYVWQIVRYALVIKSCYHSVRDRQMFRQIQWVGDDQYST